ncbi:MAG: hypothetical protein SF182_09595 [Deltaproteobacteria bacterium]|nr:hypothetical protein [Deltaproteobacteria bacterium]
MPAPARNQRNAATTSAWRRLVRSYAWAAVATGVPAALLSLWWQTPSIATTWLLWIIAVPVLLSAITLLWGLTAYPLLLALAFLFDRRVNSIACGDPDGPGVVICPLGVIRASPRPEGRDGGETR